VPEGNFLPRDGAGATGRTERYRFGHWAFDVASGQLSDGTSVAQLQPQVARLLEYLLEHQGEVISRDKLVREVWADRVVSDDAIHRCISILRKLLSPTDREALIETVPRRGYVARFPPPPPSEDPRPEETAPPAPGLARRSYRVLAAAAIAAALVIAVVFARRADSPDAPAQAARTEPPVVAVLPLAAIGEASDSEFFAHGIHNDLLTQLAKLDSLRVISGTSVQGYRAPEQNVRKIGEELGADVILEGSVQVAGDKIRINAQLIDARTDEHLWAESYDRELASETIFAAQAEIARAIATSLNATLTIRDDTTLSVIPTESMAAYRAYHRAMQMRDADPSAFSTDRYRQALREAVELDPKFARAWAELVVNLAYLNFEGSDPELSGQAGEALQSLEAVAPQSADFLIGQAGYVYYVVQDYRRAHDLISQALKMVPGDIHSIQLKSWIERRLGNFDAYVDTVYQARKSDPRNPGWFNSLLHGLILTHRYDEASALLADTTHDTYASDSFASLLRFREHRDFARLEVSAEQACRLHEKPDCAWIARIANRNFSQALDDLSGEQERIGPDTARAVNIRRGFTCWLMSDDGPLTNAPEQCQRRLSDDLEKSKGWGPHWAHIGTALLAGTQGRSDEAEKTVQHWLRLDPIDWAERAHLRDYACRILGMIGASDAAIKCIRDSLAEASYVMPFLEPYLPFYDPVRNEQAFKDLLNEIDPQ